MPIDTVAGCQLQYARRRGSAADGSPLHQDICDISMWLVQRFRVPFVHLWVDRHPFQQGREIACLSVMQWQQHLDLLAAAAREAFLALGYQIQDLGGALIPCACCDGGHSAHAALVAYTRIEAALSARTASGT
ncbi:hypothetical protein D1822_03430 [Phaeobacter inhibens]|nr:hypothetical protein PGA1_c06930 [Phaeobacter inhibens DSM 17395]AXT21945.1 hypothetical protein D1822_03430 [Phaeobacter inhibens]